MVRRYASDKVFGLTNACRRSERRLNGVQRRCTTPPWRQRRNLQPPCANTADRRLRSRPGPTVKIPALYQRV
ncbi:hypothetical protein J4732_03895 [Serratia marcescens]|uniref:Uncharacterized protein n=1 Tax=Serratia marcescens TaxID=615 RepID=A0A939NLK7_SERMA|nr:hypothetical protein [Serratia marcescens]